MRRVQDVPRRSAWAHCVVGPPLGTAAESHRRFVAGRCARKNWNRLAHVQCESLQSSGVDVLCRFGVDGTCPFSVDVMCLLAALGCPHTAAARDLRVARACARATDRQRARARAGKHLRAMSDRTPAAAFAPFLPAPSLRPCLPPSLAPCASVPPRRTLLPSCSHRSPLRCTPAPGLHC
jgi:hypothetical protein